MPELGPVREQTISFTSVRVDETGQIVARAAGSARLLVLQLSAGVDLDLIAVPGGDFLMGSPHGQGLADERPQHGVVVAPFLLGRGLVSQSQWAGVMGEMPLCRFRGPDLPADSVSRRAARSFCGRLSQLTGWTFHLPTEAQWEYACRAGSTDPFVCGPTISSDLANYNAQFTYAAEAPGAYRHTTTPAGTFPPNAFGLYDMAGVLWEWCDDPWHANYLGARGDTIAWTKGGERTAGVLRGGSWHDTPDCCRSASRLRAIAREGDDIFGFRVALKV